MWRKGEEREREKAKLTSSRGRSCDGQVASDSLGVPLSDGSTLRPFGDSRSGSLVPLGGPFSDSRSLSGAGSNVVVSGSLSRLPGRSSLLGGLVARSL